MRATWLPTGDRPSLLGSEGFWALVVTADGRLLAGSDRGLFKLDPRTGTLDPLGVTAGVPASRAFALALDAGGDVWMSAGHGLVRLRSSGATFVSRTFGAVDGNPITEFNRRAFLRTADGDFLFGGMGGFVRFRPERMRDNPLPPPLAISTLEVLGATQPRIVSSHRVRQLSLSRPDRGFAAEFAALAHADAGQMRYSYRLRGFDDDWTPAGPDRRARYPSLPPGRFTFEVRALASAGGTESMLRLPVIVPAPWWATSWFRVVALVLFSGALIVVVRTVATRRLERQLRALALERRLQDERERISRDLHDHVGSQVATLMSGIELAQLSAASGRHDRASGYLDSVAADARSTLEQLRETVWSLRTEGLSVRGLADRIDEHLRGRQKYLSRPTLQLRAEITVDQRLTSGQAIHLFRIAEEAVNNAIAHAGASRVEVAIRDAENRRIELEVRDDGTHPPGGRPDSSAGLGLRGMESRASDLGATFTWTRDPGGGTRVVVSAPTA
jgi:signal transduction histidine kinase